MVRTTIMADRELIDELRAIAKDEQVSLGEVIRQGLKWRAQFRRRPPSFIGAIGNEDGVITDDASRVDVLVTEYLLEKHSRY